MCFFMYLLFNFSVWQSIKRNKLWVAEIPRLTRYSWKCIKVIVLVFIAFRLRCVSKTDLERILLRRLVDSIRGLRRFSVSSICERPEDDSLPFVFQWIWGWAHAADRAVVWCLSERLIAILQYVTLTPHCDQSLSLFPCTTRFSPHTKAALRRLKRSR